MKFPIAMALSEAKPLWLLAADRALQLGRALRSDVRLEPFQEARAEPAAAMLRRDADVRAIAVPAAPEDAAVGRAGDPDDGAARLLGDEQEPVRLGVGGLEAPRELARLHECGPGVAVGEVEDTLEVRGRPFADSEPGDHARSLGAVRRCA